MFMECIPTLKLRTIPTETLKRQLINIFWSIFTSKFDDNNYCSYHVVCSVTSAVPPLLPPCLIKFVINSYTFASYNFTLGADSSYQHTSCCIYKVKFSFAPSARSYVCKTVSLAAQSQYNTMMPDHNRS